MQILDVNPKHFIPAKHHFNCSVFDHDGKLHLAYRANNTKVDCTLAVGEIVRARKTYESVDSTNAILNFSAVHRAQDHLFEDPRIFKFQNELWCGFTNVNMANGSQAQGIAKLDKDFVVGENRYIDFGLNMNGASIPKFRKVGDTLEVHTVFPHGMEKNWSFFETPTGLNFVYNVTNGHVVVQLDKDLRVDDIHNTEAKWIWPYGEIRGGTPPLEFDEKHFISFFHSSCRTPKDSRTMDGMKYFRLYVCGAYLFEKEAPHKVKWITRRPLIAGDFNSRRVLWNHAAVFPCGSLKFDNQWIVSYGMNDHRCRIMEISHEELTSELLKIRTK